jgi:hypothetical protein
MRARNAFAQETFFGMIFHFVAHYFHYDSKFWQTIKTLVTNPGRLTVDYWEKKRARHISPISLYIFVSAVFFLMFFFWEVDHRELVKNSRESMETPTVKAQLARSDSAFYMAKAIANMDSTALKKKSDYERSLFKDPEDVANFMEKLLHALPKMFFFMIPLMAFVLQLLFIRRKDAYFVSHSIFSLHIHAFAFVVGIIVMIPTSGDSLLVKVFEWIQIGLGLSIFFYLVLAMHNAYKISWKRSIFSSIFLAIIYIIIAVVIALIYFLYKVYALQQPSRH